MSGVFLESTYSTKSREKRNECNVTMNFLPQISQTYETLKHLGVVGFRKVVGGWTGVSQRGKKTLAGWKPMISWMGKNWSCDLIWSLVPCQPLGFGALKKNPCFPRGTKLEFPSFYGRKKPVSMWTVDLPSAIRPLEVIRTFHLKAVSFWRFLAHDVWWWP